MQVQEANVAIDYRNARCKSYSDSRQCWRNTSVHGHVACLVGRARDRWMTRYDSRLSRRPARVYVCRVRMICAFCISAAVLRAVFSCIVTVYALWCSQKIESDSRDSACEPAPSRCYAPRSHMHTGASGHASHRCLYTLGGAGKGIPKGGTRRKGERVESARVSV
jgi:hypothetical protein